jgi:GNAT superfamily N-acetyltransferase
MPATIQIRPITENDAIAITALSKQLGYSLSPEETLDNISKVLFDKDHAAFIACIDSIAVGWIHVFKAMRIESKPFIEIGGLVIDENYRKQGIGKLLVNKAREWAKEKRIDKLRVRCNRKRTEAHQFYLALGFIESKEQKVFEQEVL